MKTKCDQALDLLRQSTGDPQAAFRPGQLEAIEHLLERRGPLLVVQRTGWGKSNVYFIAAKLLREQHAGPTLIICQRFAHTNREKRRGKLSRVGLFFTALTEAPTERKIIAQGKRREASAALGNRPTK